MWQSLIYVPCLLVTMCALKTSILHFPFQDLGLKIRSNIHLGVVAKLSFLLAYFLLSICLSVCLVVSIHLSFSLMSFLSFLPTIFLIGCLFISLLVSLFLTVLMSFYLSFFFLHSSLHHLPSFLLSVHLSIRLFSVCLFCLSLSAHLLSPSECTILHLPMFNPILHSFGLATDATPHLAVRMLAVETLVLSRPACPRVLWDVECLPSAGGNEECLNKAGLNES